MYVLLMYLYKYNTMQVPYNEGQYAFVTHDQVLPCKVVKQFSKASMWLVACTMTTACYRFLASMALQQWKHGGYWVLKLPMDSACWLKISRPRTGWESKGKYSSVHQTKRKRISTSEF